MQINSLLTIGKLAVAGWQCVLVHCLLTVRLLRQVDREGDSLDVMVDAACRGGGREGPGRQRLHHTVTL